MVMFVESCLCDDQRIYVCREPKGSVIFASADTSKLTAFIESTFSK